MTKATGEYLTAWALHEDPKASLAGGFVGMAYYPDSNTVNESLTPGFVPLTRLWQWPSDPGAVSLPVLIPSLPGNWSSPTALPDQFDERGLRNLLPLHLRLILFLHLPLQLRVIQMQLVRHHVHTVTRRGFRRIPATIPPVNALAWPACLGTLQSGAATCSSSSRSFVVS
jgi:hypothetical protein